MARRELEARLEERSVAKVEALGGEALKLVIHGRRGFLDRTIFLPGGKLFVCEFKRFGTGVIARQQTEWANILRGLGFNVYFIDTDGQFDTALSRYL